MQMSECTLRIKKSSEEVNTVQDPGEGYTERGLEQTSQGAGEIQIQREREVYQEKTACVDMEKVMSMAHSANRLEKNCKLHNRAKAGGVIWDL